MTYLLDTHTILWWRQDDRRLPSRWDDVLNDPAKHNIYVSVASLWEIAIKTTFGKLEIDGTIEEFAATLVRDQPFRLLPIEPAHLGRLASLPTHHQDPFDRLLIAQAIHLNAIAVTNDANWRRYKVTVKW